MHSSGQARTSPANQGAKEGNQEALHNLAGLDESVERRTTTDFKSRVALGGRDSEYFAKRNQTIKIVSKGTPLTEPNPDAPAATPAAEESKEPKERSASLGSKPEEEPDYTT